MQGLIPAQFNPIHMRCNPIQPPPTVVVRVDVEERGRLREAEALYVLGGAWGAGVGVG
jgi:hypothetical protein